MEQCSVSFDRERYVCTILTNMWVNKFHICMYIPALGEDWDKEGLP